MPDRERNDLELIEQVVREAGAIARSYFKGEYRHWDKGRGQPVTEADLAVDRHLQQSLIGARPDYGWLSEESAESPDRLRAERTFIVDPIDGTVAFLKGRPHFSISVALAEQGRPVAAVVYNPVTEELFSARTGSGALLNGAAIRASERHSIAQCRMLAPRSTFEGPSQVPWPDMHIEQRNSIAYRLALVASGEFDAMLSLTAKHDWDLAAGDLILREAGGQFTDHRGAVLRYNQALPIQGPVAGAGVPLHGLLLDRLRERATATI